MDSESRRTIPFRTLFESDPEPTMAPAGLEPGKPPQERKCPICGGPMRGRKTAACSGRCRITASRNRRRDELVGRLGAARAALAAAEQALRAVEEIAGYSEIVPSVEYP
jgi:predicted nucleic acid-binding Zn ribbon protein